MNRNAMDLDDLYRRMAARIVAMGLHMTGDRNLAEDVLQETFLAAYRGRGGFRGQSCPETWIYRIAIHVALKVRRRRSRDERLHRAIPSVPADRQKPDHHEAAGRNERAHRLHEAMDKLSEAHRVVLSLQALRGLSSGTIAEILDVPEGTVHSRAHAARCRLRELLEAAPDHRSGSQSP